MIADRAPDLPEVLQRLRASKEPFVCLDGTLIRTDRVAQRNPDTGYHLWYSGLGRGAGRQCAGGDGFSPGSPCIRVRWSPAPPTTPLRPGCMCCRPCTGRPGWGCRSWRTRGIRGPGSASSCPRRTPARHRTRRPATTCCPPCGPRPRGPMPCSSTSGLCNESPPGPAAITAIMAAALVIITLWRDS